MFFRLKLDFNIITYAFGKFPKVMYLWVLMQLAIYVIVYPSFYWWSTNRKFGPVCKCELISYFFRFVMFG